MTRTLDVAIVQELWHHIMDGVVGIACNDGNVEKKNVRLTAMLPASSYPGLVGGWSKS